LWNFTSPEESKNLTKSFSPTFLTIFDNDCGITVEQLRNLRELTDKLPLNTEADTSTTEKDEHSLIEGLRVIYG
jgi:hypothetical protein